jgi:hypothetical protein
MVVTWQRGEEKGVSMFPAIVHAFCQWLGANSLSVYGINVHSYLNSRHDSF